MGRHRDSCVGWQWVAAKLAALHTVDRLAAADYNTSRAIDALEATRRPFDRRQLGTMLVFTSQHHQAQLSPKGKPDRPRLIKDAAKGTPLITRSQVIGPAHRRRQPVSRHVRRLADMDGYLRRSRALDQLSSAAVFPCPPNAMSWSRWTGRLRIPAKSATTSRGDRADGRIPLDP